MRSSLPDQSVTQFPARPRMCTPKHLPHCAGGTHVGTTKAWSQASQLGQPSVGFLPHPISSLQPAALVHCLTQSPAKGLIPEMLSTERRALLGSFRFTRSLVNNQSVWQEGTPTNIAGDQLALGTCPSGFV